MVEIRSALPPVVKMVHVTVSDALVAAIAMEAKVQELDGDLMQLCGTDYETNRRRQELLAIRRGYVTAYERIGRQMPLEPLPPEPGSEAADESAGADA